MSREPRQRDSVSLNSEADLPTFQEWCEGSVPQLDTDSLQKHVKQMVDVSELREAALPVLVGGEPGRSYFTLS